jgi:hypothetical protein
VSRRSPLAQWQRKLAAFERLNLCLLVEAQHDGVLGWVQIRDPYVQPWAVPGAPRRRL